MIDLKIKITGLSVYDEETPLELGLEDAKKLYEELGKVFDKRSTTIVTPWHQVMDQDIGEIKRGVPTTSATLQRSK